MAVPWRSDDDPVAPRVLVAGVGDVFLGDDGFGVEVVNRMALAEPIPGVDVRDYGIEGVHLAYELLDGRYDTLILVDAVSQGDEPGALTVVDVGPVGGLDSEDFGGSKPMGTHGLHPVLALIQKLGGSIGRVFVVGCEPCEIAERIGLSEEVDAAADRAAIVVPELISEIREVDGPARDLLEGAAS